MALIVALSSCHRSAVGGRDAGTDADAAPDADAAAAPDASAAAAPDASADVAPDASADAAVDASADAASDAGADTSGCGAGSAGSLIWSRTFVRDLVDGGVASSVLSAAPAGLVLCGDGLCLLGKLQSQVTFDQTLVAAGSEDAYLAKLTLQGAPVWSQRLGGQSSTDRFVAASLGADDLGNLTVAGACQGQVALPTAGGGQRVVDCPGNQAHMLVAHLDSSGASAWSADLGTSYSIPANFVVAVDHGGRVAAAAHVGGPITPPDSTLLIAWDADGTERFRLSLSGGLSSPTGIAFDAEGNLVLVGSFSYTVTASPGDGADGGATLDAGGSAVCVLKLTPSGGVAWSRCSGGMYEIYPGAQLTLDADGSVVLAGTFTGDLDFDAAGRNGALSPSHLSSAGQTDIYLAKLAANGDFAWQRQFGNAGYQEADLGLSTTPEGNILLPGTTDGTIVLDNQTIDTSSSSSPFIAGFSGDGRASFVVQLGDYGILTGRSGLVVGGCRTFYLAADYYGDFRAPGAPAGDSTDVLVVMAGRY